MTNVQKTDLFTGSEANNAIGGPLSVTSVARQYQTLLGLVQTTRFTGGFDFPLAKARLWV